MSNHLIFEPSKNQLSNQYKVSFFVTWLWATVFPSWISYFSHLLCNQHIIFWSFLTPISRDLFLIFNFHYHFAYRRNFIKYKPQILLHCNSVPDLNILSFFLACLFPRNQSMSILHSQTIRKESLYISDLLINKPFLVKWKGCSNIFMGWKRTSLTSFSYTLAELSCVWIHISGHPSK